MLQYSVDANAVIFRLVLQQERGTGMAVCCLFLTSSL